MYRTSPPAARFYVERPVTLVREEDSPALEPNGRGGPTCLTELRRADELLARGGELVASDGKVALVRMGRGASRGGAPSR